MKRPWHICLSPISDEDYLKVALDYLQDKQQNSGGAEKAVRLSLQASHDECQARLINLNKEYTSSLNSNHELYTPEEFRDQKAEIIAERGRLERQMGGAEDKLDRDLETAERVFNFCAFALRNFNTPDLMKKREIFGTIGSNLTLMDRKLTIHKPHPFMLIENEIAAQRALYEGLEPEKDGFVERKRAAFAATIPTLLAWESAFRTYDWAKAFPDPEVATRQIRDLLALA